MIPIKTIPLLACIFLLQACGTSSVKKTPVDTGEPVMNTTPETKTVKATDHPLWLDDPRLPEHIVAVGSSGLKKWGGEQAQYLAAMEDAQQQLSTEFKQQQMKRLALEKKNAPQDQDIDQKIKTLLLHNAIVKEEWKDLKTGRLYLWLVLPEHSTPAQIDN